MPSIRTRNSEWEYRGLVDALARSPKGTRPPFGTKAIRWGYKNLVKKFVFHMTPDKAHDFTVNYCWKLSNVGLLMDLLHSLTAEDDVRLQTDAMGVHYYSPFGLSAGLDKNGQLLRILDAAGFGFCSYGTMTAEPCEGNPKPWFHRLPEYDSLLIHAGLPNAGAAEVLPAADRMETPYGAKRHASVGYTNKAYPDGIDGMIADFAKGVQLDMDSAADVCEVNVSCPNLVEGKPFKDPAALEALFSRLDGVRAADGSRKPVLVKLPSESPAVLDPMLEVLAQHDVQGVATCNLLEDRSGYADVPPQLEGGMSGKPCNANAIAAVKWTREKYGSRFAIEGIGGVWDEVDALRMLDAGADLVGFITTLMFNGPQRASEFKAAMQAAWSQLEAEGWEAKGVDYERWRNERLHTADKRKTLDGPVVD